MKPRSGLSRRAALIGLTTSPTGILAAAGPALSAAPIGAEGGSCLVTPRSIEGPFYLDPRLVRTDIGEGRPGTALRMRLRVIEAGPCTPIANARIDIWHADAQGLYSGYEGQGDRQRLSTVGQTFLRGTQFTDGSGWAAFASIYPGWYPGRATHVHFKVLIEARTLLTGQMYFPDAINASVYGAVPAYGNRAFKRDIVNGTDFLARREDPQGRGVCTVERTGEGYLASLVIAVDRRA